MSDSNQTDRLHAMLLRLIELAPTEDGFLGGDITPPHECSFESGYETAIFDILLWLGALSKRREDGRLGVSSVQARYFLTLLDALLGLGAPLVANWNSLGLTPSAAWTNPLHNCVDLLTGLERRRLELQATAKPLRIVRAAVGIVEQRAANGSESFLLVYDSAAHALQLPGGRFEQRDENLRETLLRELSEELVMEPLREPEDVTLVQLDLPNPEPRISPTFGVLTHTEFHAYLVHFVRGLPVTQPDLYWASDQEVFQGRAADGRLIQAPMLMYYLVLHKQGPPIN